MGNVIYRSSWTRLFSTGNCDKSGTENAVEEHEHQETKSAEEDSACGPYVDDALGQTLKFICNGWWVFRNGLEFFQLISQSKGLMF